MWDRTRSRAAITSSLATTRRAQNSPWWERLEEKEYGKQQADHMPVVRQGRGSQGGRILCVGISRHEGRGAPCGGVRFPGRRSRRRVDGGFQGGGQIVCGT